MSPSREIDNRSNIFYDLWMVKKPSNADGYEAVLKHFYVNGKRHGAKNALALALGLTSRAVVDRWARYGIPEKYQGPLFRLTGMMPQQIWPENFR